MNKIIIILLLAAACFADIKITEFRVIGDSVKVLWDAPPDSDVVMYQVDIWRGTDHRYVLTPFTFAVIAMTGIPDSVFQRWSFAVLAEDRYKNQSVYSDSIAGYFTGKQHRLYADVNGDGSVGLWDLIQLLEHAGGVNLRYDLDDSGTVGLSDLLIMLPLLGRKKEGIL